MQAPSVSASGDVNVTSGDQTIDALLVKNLEPEALNQVTPAIKAALSKGMAVAKDLTPAYNLIDTIAKGGVPNEAQSIAAMAGVATAINPLAGAALMAAGTLVLGAEAGLKSLFQGLGLISDQPVNVDYVGGKKRGDASDPVPSGPSDPIWQRWDYFARYWWPPGGATAYGYMPGVIAHYVKGKTQENAVSLPSVHAIMYIVGSMLNDSPAVQKDGTLSKPGGTYETGNIIKPSTHNDFEKFFVPLLQRDLEFWWNGLPYIDPRQLLSAAVKAWNDKHPPSSADKTYSPDDGNGKQGVVPAILGGSGDSTLSQQRAAPLAVNMGPAVTSPGPGVQVMHIPKGLFSPDAWTTVHVVPPPPAAKTNIPTYLTAAPVKKTSRLLPYLLLLGAGGAAYAILRK